MPEVNIELFETTFQHYLEKVTRERCPNRNDCGVRSVGVIATATKNDIDVLMDIQCDVRCGYVPEAIDVLKREAGVITIRQLGLDAEIEQI